ncbi:tripartite tricarboxylate transporter substrate binding protein [Rhodovarius crocodyli]|uniref:Tripartite tricarboxylate transporter substrate binding protein n=1 Tax=Rhodovarius crocodyli TaxID=1979269 RepID=A0A437MFC5_9PROT|nr:tripartite tricarboxylate transporter substrate binding protein [Rhodovarius crocodyli]RVT96326.1 tripartite tricarboxylate transporter substrate binding protein [Rhodovarius crocodyli]
MFKPFMSRRAALAGAALLSTPALAPASLAQGAWPQRSIRLVVPFAPGGSVDVLARILAPALTEKLGQTVQVENRSGANGAVGGQAVAQSATDGHALLFSASLQTLAKLVMRSPGYDPLTELAPIARVGEGPVVMAISKDRPQTTLAQVIEAARQKPEDWSFGVGALGAAGHLATIDVIRTIGKDITVVPYRGTTPALADLMGGRIGAHIDPAPAMLPQVRGGNLRGIMITSAQRSPLAPDLQTTAEAGFPNLDVRSWWGFWGPAAMPAEVKAKVAQAVSAALAEPAIVERFVASGAIAGFMGSADFAAFIRQDYAKAEELFRIGRVQPE